MVSAVILDVDGVIVGKKHGFNFPRPHADVIEKFKKICACGVPIILCTAKFGSAIKDVIIDANLDNPHIADGGGLIIDPLNHKVLEKHLIKKDVALKIISMFLKEGIYMEVYTEDSYSIQEDQIKDFTKKRTEILGEEPNITKSLLKMAESGDIVKISAKIPDINQIPHVKELVAPIGSEINYIVTGHPYVFPIKSFVITAPGVSKGSAVHSVVQKLNLSLNSILGVGDSESDWDFIEKCGAAATLENGDNNIKKLVKSHKNGFIAPHIDENGMIDILSHFGLE